MKVYRIYLYSDPYRGWGDAGTLCFIPARNRDEALDKLAKSTSRKDIHIDCNAEEISIEKLRKYKNTYLKKIKELKSKISSIEKIERRILK
jgi:hypothetical protein